MSGTTKVLLGLGIGCGVLFLLCCGGGGLGIYFYGKSVQESISKDPAKIREVTAEIVAIEVPAALPPSMCMAIPIPWTNTNFMTMVQYGDEAEKNVLFLMQFAQQFDEQQMNLQWRQSMRSNGRRDMEDVDVVQSESHDIEVNGQPASFKIANGQAHQSKRNVWQVMGTFHGKSGSAMLFMQVNQDDLSKEDVIRMLDSMK